MKNDHPFFRNRISNKKPASISGTQKTDKKSLAKIPQIMANISQVLMLIAVIWGYQTTVKPIIQKEKLAEDIAKLQLDKEELENNIRDYKFYLEESERKYSGLVQKKAELEENIIVAKTELTEKERRLSALEDRLINSQEKLQESIESLVSAERSIYEKQKSFILGDAFMPIEVWRSISSSHEYLEIFKSENTENIAELMQEMFPNPTEIIPDKIQELRKNIDQSKNSAEKKANQLILIEFEQGLINNREKLQCRVPDFEKWEVAFSEALLNPEYKEICVENNWKRRAKRENWTPEYLSTLKGTAFWKSQEEVYKSQCERSSHFSIERIFTDAWSEIHMQCKKKIMSLSSIVINGESVPEEKDEVKLNPPEERTIKHLMRN
jgi:hypothetical protein